MTLRSGCARPGPRQAATNPVNTGQIPWRGRFTCADEHVRSCDVGRSRRHHGSLLFGLKRSVVRRQRGAGRDLTCVVLEVRMKFRSLALAAAATGAAFPAVAGAATTTLQYQCKYPLIGTHPVTLKARCRSAVVRDGRLADERDRRGRVGSGVRGRAAPGFGARAHDDQRPGGARWRGERCGWCREPVRHQRADR